MPSTWGDPSPTEHTRKKDFVPLPPSMIPKSTVRPSFQNKADPWEEIDELNWCHLTWSQGETVPPKHMNRYPMATRHIQITTEKSRRSFLNTDSIHTRIKMAKKMARAVGTVIKNAT